MLFCLDQCRRRQQGKFSRREHNGCDRLASIPLLQHFHTFDLANRHIILQSRSEILLLLTQSCVGPNLTAGPNIPCLSLPQIFSPTNNTFFLLYPQHPHLYLALIQSCYPASLNDSYVLGRPCSGLFPTSYGSRYVICDSLLMIHPKHTFLPPANLSSDQ